MTQPSPDRRQFTRVAFDAPLRLEAAGHSIHAQLLDLSLQGLLARRPEGVSLPPGCPAIAHITLAPQVQIEMEVALQHQEEDRWGFRCLYIDLESITTLRRLVELNTGDANLLERELTSLVH